MFNPIEMRRRMVQERIEKSFDNEIEKAKHQVGEVHPNGKWIWTEYAPGKFDWKSKKGKYYKNGGSTASTASKTPEDKEYAEKFKKNMKDASDDVLNKVISGKIQGTDADKRLAKEILDERKSSAEGGKSAKKIIDLLKVSSSKYSDIKKVTAFKTDKGNWAIDYDGANTGLIIGKDHLSEAELKSAGVKIEGANNEKKGVKSNVKIDETTIDQNVADYEKDHADVIKRISEKKGTSTADADAGSITLKITNNGSGVVKLSDSVNAKWQDVKDEDFGGRIIGIKIDGKPGAKSFPYSFDSAKRKKYGLYTFEEAKAEAEKYLNNKKSELTQKTAAGDKSDEKKDVSFKDLTKHSQVIDYAKTIDGADFEEIDSEFDDKGSKAFRLNYNGGLKLDVDFPNNSEYVYTFRDKNDNSLYEVRSTRETDETDWSVMLNPRKWANLVKSNISKQISKRKSEQTRYFNSYSRRGKSSDYDRYLDAKFAIARLNKRLDDVDKILKIS